MKRSLLCLLLSGAGSLLHGCGDHAPPGPPDISYGVDACSLCGMSIDDDRYAAATVIDEGDARYKTLIYDDVGCLLNHDIETGEVLAHYVSDHEGRSWLDPSSAVFVYSPALRTPMASGVASFADRAAAEALEASFPGEVVDLSGLRAIRMKGGLRTDPDAVAAAEATQHERDISSSRDEVHHE